MIFGIDYLGGAKFEKVILDEHPAGWAAGFFANTFGDAFPVIKKLLATGRCPLVRIQLLWSDTHAFGDRDIAIITKEAKKCEALKQQFPDVVVEVSPFCEHNVKNPDKYLDIVVANAPSCRPVNTVWQGALSKKYKNEVHGNKKGVPAGSYNFSYDGQSCVDANVEADKKKYSGSEVFFFWAPQCNGKLKLEDKTPRPQRKAWPTSRQVDSWIALHHVKGETKLPRDWLYKSHSDQHTVPPSGKDQKPVWICPTKASEIILRTRNGQIIDRARYFGTFQGGGYRYYHTDWGYLLAEKAKRIQGDPICEVVINGKVVGKINPAFRDGNYR